MNDGAVADDTSGEQMATASPPDLLSDLRVVDLTVGPGRLVTRLLADLGAEVIRVDRPPDVDADTGPDLHRAAFDANKRSVVLDLSSTQGRTRLLGLVGDAGMLVEDGAPGNLTALGIGVDVLRATGERLVVVSLSAFGQDGPYRDWVGTEWVQLALAAVVSRSGQPGEVPVLPPGELATQSAAAQAAWVALVAWFHTASTGRGDRVDMSTFEGAAKVLDPGFGIAGSATGGVPPADGPRGRPDARHLYPIFPCRDGAVRVCLLAPRQWRAMRAWLGEPEEFADPALEGLGARFAAAPRLYPFIRARMAAYSREEIVAGGVRFGFPVAAVLTASEVLHADHYVQTGAFVDQDLPDGRRVRLANGFVEVDGVRAGLRSPAPPRGADEALVDGWTPAPRAVRSAAASRPLEGFRVLDLGVIVVGAETGRLLADQGAEVIKVESRAFPDGARQSRTPVSISASFAYGHRGKKSLGLDLRSQDGKRLFRELVAVSDVVLSNFKPGTMESLGFSHAELTAINPRVVTAASSAFGPRGPWSSRMGYGPLVRAGAGLTGLWASGEEEGWCDASTVYPDHTAARIEAISVLAALARRRRTGRGARIEASQADTMLGQLAPQLAGEFLVPGSLVRHGNVGAGDAPRGLYPCGGDDEWLVVDIQSDADWRGLCEVLDRPDLLADPRLAVAAGRAAHRGDVDAAVTAWTTRRGPREAMTALQEAGVPAGMMNRVSDLLTDPHAVARGLLAAQPQPQLPVVLWAEARPGHTEQVPDPELRPAPVQFEHTAALAEQLLGLDTAEVNRLAGLGVLQLPTS